MPDQIFHAFFKAKIANKTLSPHMSEAELKQGSNTKSVQVVLEDLFIPKLGERCKTKIKFVKWVPLMKWEFNLIMRTSVACQVCVFYVVFDLYSPPTPARLSHSVCARVFVCACVFSLWWSAVWLVIFVFDVYWLVSVYGCNYFFFPEYFAKYHLKYLFFPTVVLESL